MLKPAFNLADNETRILFNLAVHMDPTITVNTGQH